MITDTTHNGIPAIRITNAHGESLVCLDGAHVASWTPAGKQDVLWMSPKSPFAEGKAIRGGVPVCWPWFGGHPCSKDLPAHGFARTRRWRLAAAWEDARSGASRVELELDQSAGPVGFHHAFHLRLTVTVGPSLSLALTTTNTCTTAFSYEDALHTYFRVGDARRIRIDGLERHRYLDNVFAQKPEFLDGAQVIDRQIDRRFTPATGTARIVDPVLGRTITVAKTGSAGTVVWNPWSDRGPTMPEIADHWPEFVCVEAANFGPERIHLLPGQAHTTGQIVSL